MVEVKTYEMVSAGDGGLFYGRDNGRGVCSCDRRVELELRECEL